MSGALGTVEVVAKVDAPVAPEIGVPVAGMLLRLLGALPGRRDDAVAILNGLFGDTLDERNSPLATPMTIRAATTVLPLDRAALPTLSHARASTSARGSVCSSTG